MPRVLEGRIPTTGRSRATLSAALDSTARTPYSTLLAATPNPKSSIAKDVEIERVSLPSVAGNIRPADVIRQGAHPERTFIAENLE